MGSSVLSASSSLRASSRELSRKKPYHGYYLRVNHFDDDGDDFFDDENDDWSKIVFLVI